MFSRIQKSLSLGFTTEPLRVYHYGLVRWLVPLNIETSCDVGTEQFPFDIQSCPIDFIYWITSKHETIVSKNENETKVVLVFWT